MGSFDEGVHTTSLISIKAMIERPAFKPHFHIETVADEGIFLLSEHGHFVLTGHLNDMVVPLIDGRRTADQIVDEINHGAKIEELYYALAMLEKNGHIVEADDLMPTEQAAFWTSINMNTSVVRERLANTCIQLQAVGTQTTDAITRALDSFGLTVAEQGDVTLVLTDDFLRDQLNEINSAHLASGKPWMLIKPVGFILWIGPIFVPGKTGCWQCLAHRLKGNREVESFLERKGQAGPFPVSRSSTRASVQLAVNAAALQLSIFVACGSNPFLEGKIITNNVGSLATENHILVKRPQCRSCGDAASYQNPDISISLSDSSKTYIQDGGHRSLTPEATYKRLEHHISPITGIVSSLTPAADIVSGPLRVYIAGHNFALKNDSLYFLRDGLRTKSCGKGMTDAQAKTSAVCEAIERYSGLFRGEEGIVHATYRELGDQAIHPNACMLFSERQYADRLQWLARNSRFQVVPLPFREDVKIDWSPVYSMNHRTLKYLPTGYLYYGYPIEDEEFFYWADSNGNAAGSTIEEAILQGFLELVERDSVCLWWYNRLPRPAFDLSGLQEPYIEALQNYYRQHDREFWVLDLTADTGLPSFAAVNRRTDRSVEDIIIGFGAHLDARVAVMRAITEMNQFIPAVLSRRANGDTEYNFHDPDSINWWKTATLKNQPYLQPLPAIYSRKVSDYPSLCSDNVSDDVRTCISIAQRLGMETLVLDQTRADIGLNVAKVIVPGLRHFWARFAPGRLYEVPVKLGWLPAPIPESLLNPIPMFV
jgi:ribosomal protein S12 methylthiotransferase accessory factor